ncbi:uncharacterized protein LOC135471950 [Liolophura sinensis]|uniref:uncharacterized protein LOC135471950 n=1 Tax=Liolophura sinensis TaxID=3198878 RepID=UPI0031594F0B
MASLSTACVAILFLGLAVEFGSCNFRPNVVNVRPGSFGKSLPSRPAIDPKALAAAKQRFAGGFNFSPYPCNLARIEPYRDPSIKKTSIPGRRSSSVPSAILNMAMKRASNKRSPEAQAAKVLMDNSRKIQASQMKTLSAARNRTKRQAPEMVYLSDTVVTEMCSAQEKRIISVINQGTECYTILPQEVQMFECASPFVRGLSNPFPFMQKFYCEPSDYLETAWYVICGNLARPEIRVHSAFVPINCGCSSYQCNFEPYQSNAPLDF